MKNIVFAVGISILMVACSSGTTVVEQPTNVTSLFRGTFQNTPGTQQGSVTLDLIEDTAGGITGNIIFESNGANCLRNGPIEGTKTGFNVSFSITQQTQQFTIITTVTDETTIETTVDGETTTSAAEVAEVSESVRTSSTGVLGTDETRQEISRSNPVVTPGDPMAMPPTSDSSAVTVVTRVTTEVTTQEDLMGEIRVQLTSSNGGSTLSGTYTSTSDSQVCSNSTGSGTMTLNR